MDSIDIIAALVQVGEELGCDSRAQVGAEETHALSTELDEENMILSQHCFVFAIDPEVVARSL